MSIDANIVNGLRWLIDSTGALVGYRNPLLDRDAPMPGGSATRVVPASTSLSLASPGKVLYLPLTVTGATTLNVTGSSAAAELDMVVVADGTNVPTVNGASIWGSNFGYINTVGVHNLFTAWNDGGGNRYMWSQLETITASPPPAPVDVIPGAPTSFTAGSSGSTTQGLSWAAPATGSPTTYTYSIAYRVNGSGAFPSPQVTGLTGTTTTITGLTASTSYDYSITATNTAGTGSAATLTAVSTTAAPGGGEDAVTTAYRAAMTTAGQTVNETHVGYADTFAKALRSAGLLTKVTAVNLAMNDTLAASLVPFIGSTNATSAGTVGFDPALGWSTDGSSGRINTGIQAVAGNWGQGAYLRTDQPTDSTTARSLMGSSSSTDAYRIIGNRTPGGTAGTMGGHISNLHGTLVGYAGITTGGLTRGAWTSIRRSSSNVELFKNGVSIAADTGAATVTTAASVPIAAPITVMGLNVSPANAPATWLASGSRVAAYWRTDGTMTSADELAFYNAMQAFQTSMARQV